MSTTLHDAAQAYVALGWYIFPCHPGTKKPAVKHGCRDASNDPCQIERWWTQNPSYNIGLACGTASGVYVVDIDVDPMKGIDGPASMIKFPALPLSPVSETPRGGFHWLFRTDDPPANKNSFRNGIDIRSEGYYIILAPSIHPNGKPYEWREGQSPWDIPIAEFPDFMRPKKQAATPWERPTTSGPIARTSTRAPQNNIEERAIAYLQQCEPSVQGFAGHDKLLWAARAMVRGFQLPEETAHALLESHFNPRCLPPWDLSNPSQAKDFRRKVTEALSTPSQKPDGWLLSEYHAPDGNDERFNAFANEIAERLLGQAPPTPTPPSSPSSAPPVDLLNPPGLVGDIAHWINSTALKSQPLLAVGAALTFCGCIMGRKVRDTWDNRTNIYTMSVAHSSAGKGHARKQLKRLIDAAGANDILGGEDVTSDAAIEKRLSDHPVTFFLWDEIGHMIQSIRASGAGNPHLSKVLPTLMKLYSAAGETYAGKEYSTGDRRTIDQPCCSLYGTTTPEKLTAGISPDEIKDGFLGRILVFLSNESPKKDYDRAANAGDVPQTLIEAVQQWRALQVVPPPGTPDLTSALKAFQVEVPTTAEAHARMLAFEDQADELADTTTAQTKGIDRLWGKAGENARKVALILACGENIEHPQIEYHHAVYACELIAYLVKTLAAHVEGNVAESQAERDKQYLLSIVVKGGKKGLTRSELTRKTQKFDYRQRESILRDLAEANEIVLRNDELPGRVYPYPYGMPTPHQPASA